jgi:predicted kinase
MEAVILIGIQASGKSTYYLQRFFETHVRISLDMLRTRHREQVLIEACLAAGQPFVVDNTNVTRKERARYIAPARAAGVRVVGYYIESTLGGSIERNRGRSGRHAVPNQAIAATYHRLELPSAEEGFDRLFRVTVGAEGEFIAQEWADGVDTDREAD